MWRTRLAGWPAGAAVVTLSLALDLLLSANFGATIPAETKLVIIGYAPLGCALLWWRRQAPMLVFLLTAVHALAGTLLVPGYRPFIACLIALYAVARYRGAAESRTALVVALAPIAAAVQDETAALPADARLAGTVGTAVVYLLLVLLAWRLGRWAAASQRRVRTLERERQEAERRSAVRERRRLASELHDIVAHTVTVMMLQAAGARRAFRSDPDGAERMLASIEDSGATALRELRQLIEIIDIYTGEESDRVDGDDLGSATGLVAAVREAGVAVDLRGADALQTADPPARHAARRIVQEALTNALRHAGPAVRINVQLRERGEHLEVEVRDSGPTDAPIARVPARPAGVGAGRGLTGLRERAERLGGVLEAGPRDDAPGWRVYAILPRSATDGLGWWDCPHAGNPSADVVPAS